MEVRGEGDSNQWVVRCSYKTMADPRTLKVHPKNPNRHPEAQLERLARILDYQGWRYPIKVSLATGFITSGHGRLMVALAKGQKKVPVDFQEYESEAQEWADIVADNAIALWAEMDLDIIDQENIKLGDEFDHDLLGMKDPHASDWHSDIEAISKIDENLDGINGKIVITCNQDDKDEVIIFIKARLMETGFTGIHIG